MIENEENLNLEANYEEAKKALILMCLNQYNDFLVAETKSKEAETKAYESMSVFGDTFKPEDLQKMISSINEIASSPKLQTDYYEKIHDDTQKDKNVKAIK